MATHLRQTDYKNMIWKNGKGQTSQIAIEPASAPFPSEHFDWRLSSATLSGESEFSLFPGHDRLLALIKGPPVIFNNQKLGLYEVLPFSGAQVVQCRAQTIPTLDLGLIYLRSKLTATMNFDRNISGNWSRQENQAAFIYVAQGTLRSGSIQVPTGDCVQIDADEVFHWELSPDSCICRILITPIVSK